MHWSRQTHRNGSSKMTQKPDVSYACLKEMHKESAPLNGHEVEHGYKLANLAMVIISVLEKVSKKDHNQ